MSFIKSLVTTVVIIFLLSFLSAGIILFSFSSSLTSDNLRPLFKSLFDSTLPSGSNLTESYNNLLELCTGQESINLPFKDSNESLAIDCKSLKEGGESGMTTVLAEGFLNNLYYKDYNCDFIDCFKGEVDSKFIFSKKANEVLISISYLTFAIFSILFISFSFFLGLRQMSSIFILNGIPVILFFLKDGIINQTSKLQRLGQFAPVMSSFFEYLAILSLISLIIGFLLIVLAEILKRISSSQQAKKKKRAKQ